MKQRTWFKVIFSAAVVTALTFSGCNQAATPEGEGAVEGQAGQPTANSGSSEGSGGGLTSWFGSSEPEPEPRSVTLDAGTPIRFRTTNALSTKEVTTGEGFVASLEEPIVQGDWGDRREGRDRPRRRRERRQGRPCQRSGGDFDPRDRDRDIRRSGR